MLRLDYKRSNLRRFYPPANSLVTEASTDFPSSDVRSQARSF